jgi:hypothetical protein
MTATGPNLSHRSGFFNRFRAPGDVDGGRLNIPILNKIMIGSTNPCGHIEVNIMKKAAAVLTFMAALGGFAVQAGQVDLGISISNGRLRSFYLAVGDHYRVPPRQVVDFRTRYGLLDEELPLVFFLAARAHVGPQAVIDLRLRKTSWLDIGLHFGLSPEIFFMSVAMERIGPPYGNAYGYYRKYGRAGDWRKVALSDREVIDLVNLRFLSEYHGLTPDAIIGMRGRERSFINIHNEIGKGKNKGPQGKEPKSPSQAKGNKKKKDG